MYGNLNFVWQEGPHAIQNGCPFPGARSTISVVPVSSARQLTHGDDVKTTLELEFDISVSCNL